jgi:hypothetical protein
LWSWWCLIDGNTDANRRPAGIFARLSEAQPR